MKKFTVLTLITLAFAVSFTFDLIGNRSANAKSNTNLSTAPVSPIASPSAQIISGTNIYALGNNNTLYVLSPGSLTFNRINTISGVQGTVTGIDYRPADGQLYALANNGSSLYTINTANASATLVSNLSPAFGGGNQSLLDFNPVVDAIRLIGANDQNFAVVSNGGTLNTAVAQTNITYAAGDVNAGTDPTLVGGAYTNNLNGAATTLFYGFDSNTDTVITIADKNATGSSNTGGGRLQTVGTLFDVAMPVNFLPTADMDIVTFPQGGLNVAAILNGNRLIVFVVDQINKNLPLGQLQNVGGLGFTVTSSDGNTNFIDVAISPIQQ